MARKDELTGKKTAFGHKMKHRRGSSGGGGAWRFRSQKSRRTWQLNLREVKVISSGKVQTMKVSMKTYKALRKFGSVDGVTLVK